MISMTGLRPLVGSAGCSSANAPQWAMAKRHVGGVAIVTGAGHGVGRGEALLLAKEGAKVVVNDLGGSVAGEGADKRPAEEVADVIKAGGGEAVANYDDVADWNGAKNLVQQAVDSFGRLDILVNNAGILRDGMLFMITDDALD